MILRGGENIYPKEIEDRRLPATGDRRGSGLGRAHPVYGEEPVLSCR